ncbi:hypothetical protein ABIE78_000317 [Sinorhizobium fredii]
MTPPPRKAAGALRMSVVLAGPAMVDPDAACSAVTIRQAC